MGQPNGVHTPLSNTESIGIGREPPELKQVAKTIAVTTAMGKERPATAKSFEFLT